MSKQSASKTSQATSSSFAARNSGAMQRQHSFGPHLSVQREATGNGVQQHAPSLVRDVINSPGHPLDAGTRSFMEPRLGYDLGRVRVHTDHQAAESAKAVSANAYTAGTHVAFAAGRYAPATATGRKTLAHELSHVVQQTSGPVSGTAIGGGVSLSHPADQFERRASAAGTELLKGPQLSSSSGVKPMRGAASQSAITVQRDPTPLNDQSGTGAFAARSTAAAETSATSSIFSAVFAGVSAVEAVRQANYAGRQAEASEDPPVQTPTIGGLAETDVELPEVKGINLSDLKKHEDSTKETETVEETIRYPKKEGVPGSGETQNPRTITREKTVSKTVDESSAEQETPFTVLRLEEGANNSAEFNLRLRFNSKDVKGGATEQGDVQGYLGGTLNSNASVTFRASPGAPDAKTGAGTARLLFGGTNVPARETQGSTGSGLAAFLTGGISGSGGSKKNENYKVQRFSGSIRFKGDGTAAIDDKTKDIHVNPQDRPPVFGDGKGTPFVTVSLNTSGNAAPGPPPPVPTPAPQKAGGAAPGGATGGVK